MFGYNINRILVTTPTPTFLIILINLLGLCFSSASATYIESRDCWTSQAHGTTKRFVSVGMKATLGSESSSTMLNLNVWWDFTRPETCQQVNGTWTDILVDLGILGSSITFKGPVVVSCPTRARKGQHSR